MSSDYSKKASSKLSIPLHDVLLDFRNETYRFGSEPVALRSSPCPSLPVY